MEALIEREGADRALRPNAYASMLETLVETEAKEAASSAALRYGQKEKISLRLHEYVETKKRMYKVFTPARSLSLGILA